MNPETVMRLPFLRCPLTDGGVTGSYCCDYLSSGDCCYFVVAILIMSVDQSH